MLKEKFLCIYIGKIHGRAFQAPKLQKNVKKKSFMYIYRAKYIKGPKGPWKHRKTLKREVLSIYIVVGVFRGICIDILEWGGDFFCIYVLEVIVIIVLVV